MRRTAALLAVLVVTAAIGPFAEAEVVQKADVRVAFEGKLTPKSLPRDEESPVHVAVGARITPLKGTVPPRLETISIAINRAGRFSPGAFPVCTVRDIQPSTTQNALKACRSSLVGTGRFSAEVPLRHQATFPAGGKLYAFNGVYEGHPAILAHVYGTKPVPTSFTMPFVVTSGRGEFGTVLTASLADPSGKAGYITGLSLNLGATRGHSSYLSASCSAPKGFGGATFNFARASFQFSKETLTSTLTRSCKAR